MLKKILGESVADTFGDAALDGVPNEISEHLLGLPENAQSAMLLIALNQKIPDQKIVPALGFMRQLISLIIDEAQREGLAPEEITRAVLGKELEALLELPEINTAYLPSVKDEKANFKTYRIVGRIQAYLDGFEDASIGSFGPGPECGMNA